MPIPRAVNAAMITTLKGRVLIQYILAAEAVQAVKAHNKRGHINATENPTIIDSTLLTIWLPNVAAKRP